jgi:phosphatidylserine decarboxylase
VTDQPPAAASDVWATRYASLVGVGIEYLPQSIGEIDYWLRDLAAAADTANTPESARPDDGPVDQVSKWQPSVQGLAALIEADPIIRMYVSQMIEEVPAEYRVITDTRQLLNMLSFVISRAPKYHHEKAKRNPFPMSTVFAYMMMTQAGEAAFRNKAFNDQLRVILKEWCALLDSPASRDVVTREGWLSPYAWAEFKLDDFVIPDPAGVHCGFTSFNDFFHRWIKMEKRPVSGPDDPTIIVSPNDGTFYGYQFNIQRHDQFWIKGQPYSIADILNNTSYVDRFVGGSAFQTFLSGADYHRFHAPVSGFILSATIIPGLMFSDAESAGYDPDAGTKSLGYECSVNTRALIFIQADYSPIGTVCVIPVGITEISSIVLTQTAGRVTKGDELGYFSYGGSTLCTLFQPGAVAKFAVNQPIPPGTDAPTLNVRAAMASTVAYNET